MLCSNCGKELPADVRFCPACGTPTAPAAPTMSAGYPAPAAQPPLAPTATFGDVPRQPLSGGPAQAKKKSGCGKILLVLLVIGALVAVGLGVAGYYGYRFAEGKLKSSEAYTLAVETLKANPEVAEKMGEIKETGFPLGSFDENAAGGGSAAYRMSVTGAKASGNYDVVMSRRAGRWQMGSGKVTLAGGGTINVWPDGSTPDPLIGEEGADTPSGEGGDAVSGGAAGSGKVVSGGVIKATSKPEPAYPAIAKAVRASGPVTVEVLVDERGRVSTARALAGHPLLRASAEAAARQARFSPTLLAGRPVKVRGTITYNFVAPPQ